MMTLFSAFFIFWKIKKDTFLQVGGPSFGVPGQGGAQFWQGGAKKISRAARADQILAPRAGPAKYCDECPEFYNHKFIFLLKKAFI